MHNTRDKVPQVLQTERRIGLADPDPAVKIDADPDHVKIYFYMTSLQRIRLSKVKVKTMALRVGWVGSSVLDPDSGS